MSAPLAAEPTLRIVAQVSGALLRCARSGGAGYSARTTRCESRQRHHPKADRVKFTLACSRNNEPGDEFADHLWLARAMKLLAGSVKSFAHRGSCFGLKCAAFGRGID